MSHRVSPVIFHIGTRRKLFEIDALDLALDEVDAALELFAEFHILEMSRHNTVYAAGMSHTLTPNGLRLPPELEQPPTRSDSTNVIGNIGEGLVAAIAMECFDLSPSEITRIRRQKQRTMRSARKCPDFVMDLSRHDPAAHPIADRVRRHNKYYSSHLVSMYGDAISSFQGLVPLEAKGSARPGGGDRWGAIWQLVDYWRTVSAHGLPIGPGCCGVISSIRKEVRAADFYLLVPRDHIAFAAALETVDCDNPSVGALIETFSGDAGFVGDDP